MNRASWSGGIGTSAEVPAITSSSPGHSGFNIPSVGALDPLRGIVGNVAAQIPELSKKKKERFTIVLCPLFYKIQVIHALSK